MNDPTIENPRTNRRSVCIALCTPGMGVNFIG
jgi:hypothetical protein